MFEEEEDIDLKENDVDEMEGSESLGFFLGLQYSSGRSRNGRIRGAGSAR